MQTDAYHEFIPVTGACYCGTALPGATFREIAIEYDRHIAHTTGRMREALPWPSPNGTHVEVDKGGPGAA